MDIFVEYRHYEDGPVAVFEGTAEQAVGYVLDGALPYGRQSRPEARLEVLEQIVARLVARLPAEAVVEVLGYLVQEKRP